MIHVRAPAKWVTLPGISPPVLFADKLDRNPCAARSRSVPRLTSRTRATVHVWVLHAVVVAAADTRSLLPKTGPRVAGGPLAKGTFPVQRLSGSKKKQFRDSFFAICGAFEQAGAIPQVRCPRHCFATRTVQLLDGPRKNDHSRTFETFNLLSSKIHIDYRRPLGMGFCAVSRRLGFGWGW